MPIGDQKCGDKIIISASELRSKYDNLIKEAINNARPSLNIIRSDDMASPGTITLKILDLLMNADYVVADITYPNPNVFYELGIRHTCRLGTILIKEKKNTDVPFDISLSRYIDYEDSTAGLKKLSEELKNTFDYFDEHPNVPDNQVLEIASFKKYKFLDFDDKEEKEKDKQLSMINAFIRLGANPKLIEISNDTSIPEKQRGIMAMQELAKSPEDATMILKALIDSGSIIMPKPSIVSRQRNGRKSKY
jgi:hypothetical protein